MASEYPPVNYSEYLKIDEITDLQNLKSVEYGRDAHDEMLFIIIHQVYELWFKQIVFELDSVIQVFSQDKIHEREMLKAASRLQRIIEIQKLLIDQVTVLETMTPLDFLEFREFLVPASGFQSKQFRLIENKLGLIKRLPYNKQDYKNSLKESDKPSVESSETNPSLFDLLEKWLERTPFLASDSFDFWKTYRQSVEKKHADTKKFINASDSDKGAKDAALKNLAQQERSFHSIFDKEEYTKLQKEGYWRLSHNALCAALFVHLYRDEPLLQLPFHLMTHLQAIDENFTQWRYRHALMAHRMLGAKMGTGGSTGHKYLKAAGDRHKVFQDFFNLATFFIKKSDLPELPKEIRDKLGFRY